MFKSKLLFFLFCITVFACSNSDLLTTKKISKINWITTIQKEGFDPLKHGFSCDSISLRTKTKGDFIEKYIVMLGKAGVDTLVVKKKMATGAEKKALITDFNFDGFCDFILPDESSATAGGMDYYYFLYDTTKLGYQEVKSLPKFNGGVKMDIKNHRVKIYCPHQECFAYYKYQENKTFKLVKGEFKAQQP